MGSNITPLGMGCWPIGGAMYAGSKSLGYTGSDDTTSLATIHAALDHGITLFDTAAAYGAGHSEKLLGQALRDRPEALVVTKFGVSIDETTKQLSRDPFQVAMVIPDVEDSLRRLNRDRIDLLLLHINEAPITEAEQLFDEGDRLVTAGKLRAYGWSTDFPERATALAGREHFKAVEFADNVLIDAQNIRQVAEGHDLHALNRSPLAMGLLSGKYGRDTTLPADDIRSAGEAWLQHFQNGRTNPEFVSRMDAIRELLTTGGRTLVQGALGWLWAKSDLNIPIPGARTPEQIAGSAGAVDHGPLPKDVMKEIETMIVRNPDAADKPRQHQTPLPLQSALRPLVCHHDL
ncbi:aldo/keto reductase [Cognatiyoonia sp.]|uniref:aldo/keto reductase n=1 Tax=Cognatiyoonia sp. TaxID=2211652 RepID=UPI003F6992B8